MDKLTFKEWSVLSDLQTIAPLGEDFEFSMARGELKTAQDAVKRLMGKLKGEGDLEAWVQSKITKAAEYLDTVADHMDGGEDDTEKKEVKESKEAKKCPDGKYWCMTDNKCKKIPKGWHMMRSGRIMKDDDHEEENKNGNGNGEGSESNGGGVSEGWSAKYKRSIDCDNPKGFSQRAHCQGKKKVEESCGSTHSSKKKKKKLSEMISTSSTGGKFRDISSKEEQDQLDKERSERRKERSEKYKAHLAKLRGETREKGVRFYDKKGSGYIRDGKKVYDESAKLDEKCWDGYKQLGMKKKGKKVVPNCVKEDSIDENKSGDSSLRDWFTKSRASDGTPGWVQLGGKYAGKPCAKQPGQTTKPKCGSSKMKAELSDKEEERAFRRKNQEDPNPDRKGKAKMVATEEKDACYSKVKSRYKVWPSAYASGALVKCRKVGAKNWGNKTQKEGYEFSNWRDEFKATEYESVDIIETTPLKETEEIRYCPKCKKNEKKRECKYGEKYWKMFSLPASLGGGGAYDPNEVHPANEGLSFEIGGGHKKAQKMGKIRNLSKGATGGEKDAAQAALKRLGGGVSLPLADSVIYPGQLKTEDYQKLQSTGNVFSIMLMWRGKTYRLQLFFSGSKRPSREEVKAEIQKFYPGGILTHYYPSPSDPTQPIVVIQR